MIRLYYNQFSGNLYISYGDKVERYSEYFMKWKVLLGISEYDLLAHDDFEIIGEL